ncbi:hypothetical protein L9F63_026733, partial [Diploptera punctata]
DDIQMRILLTKFIGYLTMDARIFECIRPYPAKNKENRRNILHDADVVVHTPKTFTAIDYFFMMNGQTHKEIERFIRPNYNKEVINMLDLEDFDLVFDIRGEEEFDRVYQRIQLEEQENRPDENNESGFIAENSGSSPVIGTRYSNEMPKQRRCNGDGERQRQL